MTAQIVAEDLRPTEALEALMARHGVMRVLLALLPVLIRRRGVARLNDPLSQHLARDMGLTSEPPNKGHWHYF